jgi:hypothetical protein
VGWVRNVLAIVGLVMIVSGCIYGHSSEFKLQCAAHKVVGFDMGWFQNVLCDVEFDVR